MFLLLVLYSLGLILTRINGYTLNLLEPRHAALFNMTNYDASVRPPGFSSDEEPVEVIVNLFIRSVERIDTSHQEYDLQITFRQNWIDRRLIYPQFKNGNEENVTITEVKHFWKPDIFFSNEKKGRFHNIMQHNSFMRISSSGRIMFSSRISLTLACETDPWEFPFDTVRCPLRLPSYGYTTKDMILKWSSEEPLHYSEKSMQAAGFDSVDTDLDTCYSVTNTGEYSCLIVKFLFQRRTMPYLLRSYYPYTLISAASWIPFWVSPVSNPSLRLMIGSLTCLTSLLLPQGDQDQPSVDLTKLDIWIGFCVILIYLAFFESVFALKWSLSHQNRIEPQKDDLESVGKKEITSEKQNLSEKVDKWSRLAFPNLFIFFGVVYFFL